MTFDIIILLLAFVAGGVCGMVAMALVVMGRQSPDGLGKIK